MSRVPMGVVVGLLEVVKEIGLNLTIVEVELRVLMSNRVVLQEGCDQRSTLRRSSRQ